MGSRSGEKKAGFRWPAKTFDSFYPQAHRLRQFFDEVFADARAAGPRRLVFEPWWVDNQFYHLKTPAGLFFPQNLIQSFLTHLLQWGRTNLGCQMVSPPWLSLYLDGHFQNWHADNPQGPFAFVYSLTPSPNAFDGGRTFLLQNQALSYWSQTQFQRGVEIDQLMSSYEPRFNRLLVFDPRIPHSVERVRNAFDPRDGRLVIHGWFSDPRPTLTGGLSFKSAKSFFEDAIPQALEREASLDGVRGYTCLEITVKNNGEIHEIGTMVSTLITTAGERRPAQQALQNFIGRLENYRLRPSSSKTVITLPLIFS